MRHASRCISLYGTEAVNRRIARCICPYWAGLPQLCQILSGTTGPGTQFMDLRVERLHGNGELVLAELEAVWFYEWVADAAHGVGERFGVLE